MSSEHSLWSRVAMFMLQHGAGAFNPLHHKLLSIQCGHNWPIFLTAGTWWEHSPEAGELHTCPWLLFVTLAGSSWHLLRTVSGPERSQGRLCYGVHSLVDNFFIGMASTIPWSRGRLRAVSQERQQPHSTTMCPQWSAEPQSESAAPDSLQRTRGWWVQSWELS